MKDLNRGFKSVKGTNETTARYAPCDWSLISCNGSFVLTFTPLVRNREIAATVGKKLLIPDTSQYRLFMIDTAGRDSHRALLALCVVFVNLGLSECLL